MTKNHCHAIAIVIRIYNFVNTFDVRHDANFYRVSHGITCSWKMQIFSIISFLNDLKLYDEQLSTQLNEQMSHSYIYIMLHFYIRVTFFQRHVTFLHRYVTIFK